MTVEVMLTATARQDIRLLPHINTEATVNWLTLALAENPLRAGVSLQGQLAGYRCLTSPQGIKFIFVTDGTIVLVLLVLWSELAIGVKKAELIGRVAALRGPNNKDLLERVSHLLPD